MIIFTLIAAFACPTTKLVNKTKLPWNAIDTRNQNTAKERCPIKYKNSPCLVKFTKVGPQDYHATCGARR